MLEFLPVRLLPLCGVVGLQRLQQEQLFVVIRHLPSEVQLVKIETDATYLRVIRNGREEIRSKLILHAPAVTLRNLDKALVLLVCSDLSRYLLRLGTSTPYLFRLANWAPPSATDLAPRVITC